MNINTTNRNNARKLLTFCGHAAVDVRTMTIAQLRDALQRAINEGLITQQQVDKHLNNERKPAEAGSAPGRGEETPRNEGEDEDEVSEEEATTTGGEDDGDSDGDGDNAGESEETGEGEESESEDGESEDEGEESEGDGESESEDGDEGEGEDDAEDEGEGDGEESDEETDDDDEESDSEGDDEGDAELPEGEEDEDDEEDDGEEIEHPVVARVVKYIRAGHNVALVGPAGTGKSFIARQVARKLDRDFYVNGACMSKYDLIGYCDAGGVYHSTPAYDAFVGGGIHCFDELDASAPDAVVAFNGMTDDQPFYTFPNGQQEKHEQYTAIACMNTFGNGATAAYVGRYKQDAAAMDRFTMVHVDYDPKVEKRIAGKHADILQRVRDIRAACDKLGIQHVVSYRMIDKAVTARDEGVSKRDIDRDIMFAKLDEGAVKQLRAAVNEAKREREAS